MKGRILSYNVQDGLGIISGDDNKRYNFVAKDWRDAKSPAINQYVDFVTNEDKAESIFLVVGTDKQKSKIVAGLLAIFFGPLAIHKFYLGCTTAGILTILIFFLGFILVGVPSMIITIVVFVEAVLYLIKSDEEFEQKYVINKRCWF